MCSNQPGIKLEPVPQRLEDKIEHVSSYAHVVHTTAKQVSSRTLWKEQERLQSVQKVKMRAQNYCFSLSNMQICFHSGNSVFINAFDKTAF